VTAFSLDFTFVTPYIYVNFVGSSDGSQAPFDDKSVERQTNPWSIGAGDWLNGNRLRALSRRLHQDIDAANGCGCV